MHVFLILQILIQITLVKITLWMGWIIYKCVGGWGLGGLHCIVNLLVKRIWYQTHWWKLTARDANLQIMTLKFHWKFLLFSAVFMYSIVILPGTGETDTILRQTITKNNKRLVSGSLHSPTAGTIWKCFCSLLCLSGDIHRTVYFFFYYYYLRHHHYPASSAAVTSLEFLKEASFQV